MHRGRAWASQPSRRCDGGRRTRTAKGGAFCGCVVYQTKRLWTREERNKAEDEEDDDGDEETDEDEEEEAQEEETGNDQHTTAPLPTTAQPPRSLVARLPLLPTPSALPPTRTPFADKTATLAANASPQSASAPPRLAAPRLPPRAEVLKAAERTLGRALAEDGRMAAASAELGAFAFSHLRSLG